MLTLENIQVKIGPVEAVRGFSMSVEPGAMVGLAGRNGAGKTTVMRAIMGIAAVSRGRIRFNGQDMAKQPVHARAAEGIGYMPETRGLIPELSVEENMLLPSWVISGLDGKARLDFVYEVMPELKGMAKRKALQLSGGQQKMVALGRALTAGHRLLLLDEPFEGVAPALAQRLSDVISALKSEKLSIVMSMSEMTHSHTVLDHVFGIERGANAMDAAA
ncbi:ABC transporter ATP-binding protein [Aurantimonas coralicida]|uniref:ABC transporter ATP-binding protein n=1 Tax=Aurantimonas coralicida TaxID=182270 RepID=UPI001D196DE5|nr:ATP-binding cassette domain-containing protein [Aurantimonas coralicida]MCC4296107.1 ATP-binding cassette domain-containing protein [Aurantimonas coralicida]MCD1642657.1 ATP-binding cassette domain-containing protein [Aurantimonas coralicida]MCW7543336.1 ATP-binding cassette domain-containing protein [Aurantimonas litoralis]MDE0923913.1 ATP-binding cassette domain-containing protein [Aurantimonas coralicida]